MSLLFDKHGVAWGHEQEFSLNVGLFRFVALISVRSYVVGQLSSRTHHRVLAVAVLDKNLSMV